MLIPVIFPKHASFQPQKHRTHTIIKTCHFICFMSLLSKLLQTSVDPIQVSQSVSIPFQGCRESKYRDRNSTYHLGERNPASTEEKTSARWFWESWDKEFKAVLLSDICTHYSSLLLVCLLGYFLVLFCFGFVFGFVFIFLTM